ncbi:MAG TPA: multiheme c-type cytochrome [Terriglobia bacterium]|nr:multiheme c-type cytochrome [Terriglobia bacterium]
MARSLTIPAQQVAGTFVHPISNTRFTVGFEHGQMFQSIERNGISSTYQLAFAIGSGSHAISYMIEISGHLFQSPICYYPGRGGWAMAPGYEGSPAPDFYRPITPQCLFCHSGSFRQVPETLNTYPSPVFISEGITCERCHGPSEAHLRNPVPGSIINPAKLPIAARDSICEQCHLSGEAFIKNPGKRFADFKPGEDLEKTFAVYVFESSRDPAHPDALTVISQSQQLALSRCARMSQGKLWCGTCHDPHRRPSNPMVYYRARCLSCHSVGLPKQHPSLNSNCISCHMPKLPVTNGGHTIFTDHRIAIYTPEELKGARPATSEIKGSAQNQALVAWREPPAALRRRNLGLADVEVGERVRSIDLVSQGYRLLIGCLPQFPNDPAVLTAVGQVLLGGGHAQEAQTFFEKIVQLRPGDAASHLHSALAWRALHKNEQAISELNESLRLDPLIEQPYDELAAIYREEGNRPMLRDTYQRRLKAFPQSLEARAALASLNQTANQPGSSHGGGH